MPSELFFVIGADAFAEIETWRDYPAILDPAHFAVVSRPGLPGRASCRERLPRLAARMVTDPPSTSRSADAIPLIILIDAPTADVSSTAIRAAPARPAIDRRTGPAAVQQHIEQHGLYTSTTPGRRAIGRAADSRGRQVAWPRLRNAGKRPRLPAQIERAIAAAEDKKAVDLVVLDLRKAAGFHRLFLICSGTNARQIRAIADARRWRRWPRTASKPAHVEGYDRSEWILLDYFDFIVHIFAPETRVFYSLERLWGNAERIEIPAPVTTCPRRVRSCGDQGS